MSPLSLLRVYRQNQLLGEVRWHGMLEVGRQADASEVLLQPIAQDDFTRVAIASRQEVSLSRKLLRCQRLDGDRIRLVNTSASATLTATDSSLAPQATLEVAIPCQFQIGEFLLCIEGDVEEENALQSLVCQTQPPNQSGCLTLASPSLLELASSDPHVALDWLNRLASVLQSAAGSVDFYDRAAEALLELVAMDVTYVLLRSGDGWKTVSMRTRLQSAADMIPQASRRVLDEMCQQKTTVWQTPQRSVLVSASLVNVDSLVAAPILNPAGNVIGAMYGARHANSRSSRRSPVDQTDAALTETLASAVAAGLARLDQEKAALAARVRFEEFFTPELAKKLAEEPDLLDGRDAEVSVLFCDIRGFSRISEQLGPTDTMHWISSVMAELSDCVAACQGVLVDYIGDELLAMWGAPSKQPDHARLACQAALLMLDSLSRVDEKWMHRIGQSTRVGIGINTGMARVGNTGSHRKFKYGPLGNTVNLASRVQGATKYLKSAALITGATRAALDTNHSVRKLCTVRVVNIEKPVDLFELTSPVGAGGAELQRGYESALSHFEQGEFREACRILGELTLRYPSDGPTLLLLERTVSALIAAPAVTSYVWELPGK